VITQYLLPASAAVIGLVAVARWVITLRHAPVRYRDALAGGTFIPLFFFILACFGFFRHVFHFRQFMWALVPATAWLIERSPNFVRWTTALLWAPGLLTMLRSALLASTIVPATVALTLPSGGTLHAAPALADRVAFLERFASNDARGLPIVYLAGASGWYAAYRISHATRHTWWEGFDAPRPYEQQAFLDSLSHTAALIVCDRDGQAWPSESGLPALPFSPKLADAIRPRLVFWMNQAGCHVYHIR
jgi:hypothetical protein